MTPRASPTAHKERVCRSPWGWALSVLLAAATACGVPVPSSPYAFSPDAGWSGPTGNRARLGFYRDHESKFYRQAGQLPRLCIAFSGGGMRAAAFSIGVMSGLHDKGVLQRVDLASAISGGGYALSWYVAQHYDRWVSDQGYDPRALDKELFNPNGLYQKDLARHFELFDLRFGIREGYRAGVWNTIKGGLSTSSQLVFAVASTALSIPINLLANGLFGWHLNVSPVQPLYENSIERAFLASPMRDNIGWGFGVALRGRDDPIRYPELLNWLTDLKSGEKSGRHVMFPIHGLMLTLDTAMNPAVMDLANHQFEISPLRAGIDSVGYYKHALFRTWFDHVATWPGITLSRATAISGAAVDSDALLDSAAETAASVLNLELGMHVANPAIKNPYTSHSCDKCRRMIYPFLPFPLYFFAGWPNSVRGIRLHLSDGGHSEKLGVFTLARRLCKHMIVVDSGADSTYAFSSYKVVRDAVRRELGATLQVQVVDDWLEFRDALTLVLAEGRRKGGVPGWPSHAPPERERSIHLAAALSALRDGLRQEYKCANPPPPPGASDSDIRDAMKCALDGLPIKPRSNPTDETLTRIVREDILFDGSNPVAKGELVVHRGAEEPLPLEVSYIKLSMYALSCSVSKGSETPQPPRYPYEVCKYHTVTKGEFPFQSTGDIAFDPDQYRAYRDLGVSIVEWAWE